MKISRNAFIKRILGGLAAVGIGARAVGKPISEEQKLAMRTLEAMADQSAVDHFKVGDRLTMSDENGVMKSYTVTSSTTMTEIKPPIL